MDLSQAPFQVVRQLGRGGMGAVYEVRLPGDNRPLAAKLLLTGASPTARARFQREGQVVARLRHPGIVSVHAAGELPTGMPYLVFDLVEGGSLSELLERSGALSESRALEIGIELADALGCAHEQGLVHRDVKPPNVMLDLAGRVRLADFGVALACDLERLTQTGQLTGTPLYMAPEQVEHGEAVTPATDVYAAGVVLFEAVAGQPPITGDSLPQIVYRIREEPPLPLRKLAPQASRGMEAILACCLAKDPAQRYPDGNALAADLRALRDGETVSAQGMAVRARRALTWRRLVVVSLLLAFLVGGAGLALYLRGIRGEDVAALTERLEGLEQELRRASRERVLERLRQEVPGGLEALERSRQAQADPAALERLSSVVRLLERRLNRAEVLALLERARADGLIDASELGKLWAACRRVPLAKTVDTQGLRAFEAARGRIALACGQHRVARQALGAALGKPDGKQASWPTAWALAWAEVFAGNPGDSARWIEPYPARLLRARAEVALAEASLTRDPARRKKLLAQVPQLLGSDRSPAAKVLRLQAQVEASSDDVVKRVELLHTVRALSDPPALKEVAPGLRARASLVEAVLLWRLGWYGSAAHAFARAGELLPVDAVEGIALPAFKEGGERVLLALDVAALFGEAWCRARLLDEEAADATAKAAVARARLASSAVAGLAQQLGARVPSADEGQLLLCEGEAELAAFKGEAQAGLELARARRLKRARRAFRLALRGDLSATARARAQAGLAIVETRAGRRAQAEEALKQSLVVASPPWQALHARGLLRARSGKAEQACADYLAAVEQIGQRAKTRPLARQALQLRILSDGFREVRKTGRPELRVWSAICRMADEIPLSCSQRLKVHTALSKLAVHLSDTSAKQEAWRAIRKVRADTAVIVKARQTLSRAEEKEGGAVQDPRLRAMSLDVLERSPTYHVDYTTYYRMFGQYRRGGFDAMVLAFEVSTLGALVYMSEQRHINLASQTGKLVREIGQQSFLHLLRDDARSTELKVRRDDRLREGVAVLQNLLMRGPVPLKRRIKALGAARAFFLARPDAMSAATLEGCLRLFTGDYARAVTCLRRARRLDRPYVLATNLGHRTMLSYYLALAHAGLRQMKLAERALFTAVEENLHYASMIRAEPLFFTDRNDPHTLPERFRELAEQVAKKFKVR